jgi:outer membrane protein
MKHTTSSPPRVARTFRPATVVVMVFFAAADALAQPATVPLTLEDARSRASDTSHRLAEMRARETQAQATIGIRRAADRPTVTVSGGYTRTDHIVPFGVLQPTGRINVIYPDIPDNYFTHAGLQWPIYTSGRSDALERAAEAEARAVAAELRVTRADLRLEVTRAFWARVTADDAVRVFQEALERAEAHVRDIKAMFDAGLVPPSDVASAEAQRSRERMQLIETQNAQRATDLDLKRLTGLPSDADVRIELQPPAGAVAESQEDLVAAALQERAERDALRERVAAAEERQTAAAAGLKPTIAVSANGDFANPNPRIFPRAAEWRGFWDATLNVSWPLWDGGRSKAEAAEAGANAAALREQLADLDTLIALEVRQRQLDIESARAVLAAAADTVASAQEARRVLGERFRVGVATSTDVLDAQVTLLQAELDHTRAASNLNLAEARLERALGR